jgi:hypothetical protein
LAATAHNRIKIKTWRLDSNIRLTMKCAVSNIPREMCRATGTWLCCGTVLGHRRVTRLVWGSHTSLPRLPWLLFSLWRMWRNPRNC